MNDDTRLSAFSRNSMNMRGLLCLTLSLTETCLMIVRKNS